MIQQVEILRRFLQKGLNLSPEALDYLTKYELAEVEELLEIIPDKPVLEVLDIERALEEVKKRRRRAVNGVEGVGGGKGEGSLDGIGLIKIPTNLGVKGSPDEFINLMRKRFEFLKSVLLKDSSLDPIPISSLLNSPSRNGDSILIIGMVMEKRALRDHSIRMMVDDESGSIPVIFRRDSRYWEMADKVPVDSVLAIRGTLIRNRLYADSFRIPDFNGKIVDPASASGKVAFISDTHVGSKYFNEKALDRFMRWLSGDGGGEVKYLVICGDLVDGIGVYPNQEDELKIADVYKQFELASEFIERIPKGIKIVYVPGNHEPVRQAEPQPVVPDEFLDFLLDARPDLIALPNPAMISIEGVRVLIYHGRSLNAMFKHIPGLQPVRPETVVEAMRWMLRLRHLAPIYGEHPLSPEREDWLLIDQMPHILHTGHIHVYGVGEYKGVRVVNSGTFENETPYIKSLGIEVTVGKVPILDLRDLKIEVKDFS